MKKLIFVTVLWAFSFSLIGEFLAGRVDSYFAAFSRVVLALGVFLPFMIKDFAAKNLALYAKVAAIGAVQIVQGANLCFGVGQSAYKFLLEKQGFSEQRGVFGYFFVGASAVTGVAFAMFGNPEKINLDLTQGAVLLWLGIGASGLGYFLWNKGACEVDSGTLAIMNNALIPAAIIVNLVFWHKDADILRLCLGGAVIYISLLIHNKIIAHYEQKTIGI